MRASREATTASVTRSPAPATLRTSTPSPSAAIDTMVSTLAVAAIGGRAACGISPPERRPAIARNARMNHGTRRWIATRPGFGRSPAVTCGAGSSVSSRSRLAPRESASTTGPSISTRTSLTRVPTCTLSAATGAVAASTCGTA